jgi:hypothetical protein
MNRAGFLFSKHLTRHLTVYFRVINKIGLCIQDLVTTKRYARLSSVFANTGGGWDQDPPRLKTRRLERSKFDHLIGKKSVSVR